ncbi:MAG: HD domain-containing protein [Gammaproteobacteria bacterium]|nr:HD domain-containing protein [Gammaproteobacteria bacterium]MCW8928045.1 HD domain-containing protein [Gammaproteobacteria bacterium]MCW8958020.1 HD domain-containing protein [Gammaproteobacteria bacterium]MCW8973479.1 HD domain-containing protein [Gammaproteobacteria bacterium]MCW8993886.1 HD domain-containing protein [Gammaproteobacteria bacterium]
MSSSSVVLYRGLLDGWQEVATPREKVRYLHRAVRERHSEVHRISVSTYDHECDILKTYVDSTDNGNPLSYHQVKLSNVASLNRLKRDKRSRIINDLSSLRGGSEHLQKIRDTGGFLASFTVPMFVEGRFLGFVFFNSRERGVFNEQNQPFLELVAHLLAMVVGAGLQQLETLRGALKTATYFSHHRDPETGEHLERMARFSRLIARELARARGYNDEFVEDIFWFAPIHDIGKIAIADEILLKPGKLTPEEFERMKEHTLKGKEIIHNMLDNFSIRNDRNIEMVSNIAVYHHENVDGSGYPHGLKGEDIPLEARIVAVADVFDALTSERPYKKAWSNDEAYTELERLSGWKLDPVCVEALCCNRKEVEQIQQLFRDDLDYQHG